MKLSRRKLRRILEEQAGMTDDEMKVIQPLFKRTEALESKFEALKDMIPDYVEAAIEQYDKKRKQKSNAVAKSAARAGGKAAAKGKKMNEAYLKKIIHEELISILSKK